MLSMSSMPTQAQEDKATSTMLAKQDAHAGAAPMNYILHLLIIHMSKYACSCTVA